jgi:hypothetical protein
MSAGKRLSNLLNAAGYDTFFVGDWKPLHLMMKFWIKQTKKEEF